MSNSDGLIPLFTYGTLQPRQALWSMLGAHVHRGPYTAAVTGYELYSNQGGSYPYLMKNGDPASLVYGTMTFLPYTPGGALDTICGMEVGAGYDAQVIEAGYFKWVGGERKFFKEQALAFVWTGNPRSWLVGEKIKSGSWALWREEREFAVENEVEKFSANRSPQTLARPTNRG